LKVPGYYDQSRKNAWIEAEVWEEFIGDDLAKKARARLKEADARLRDWQKSDEAKQKRKLMLEELMDLVRDPGVADVEAAARLEAHLKDQQKLEAAQKKYEHKQLEGTSKSDQVPDDE